MYPVSDWVQISPGFASGYLTFFLKFIIIYQHMKQCFFCSQNLKDIDYKETDLLKRFVSSQAKIIDPKHTAICAKHQRLLSQAIKRARHMGLLPFVSR